MDREAIMKPGERCTCVAKHETPHDHNPRYENIDWRHHFGKAHERCTYVEPLPPPAFNPLRSLLMRAIDPDDKAVVEAAAILAAGHGVRFIVTIHNGLMADVHAERLDYDTKGKIR